MVEAVACSQTDSRPASYCFGLLCTSLRELFEGSEMDAVRVTIRLIAGSAMEAVRVRVG